MIRRNSIEHRVPEDFQKELDKMNPKDKVPVVIVPGPAKDLDHLLDKNGLFNKIPGETKEEWMNRFVAYNDVALMPVEIYLKGLRIPYETFRHVGVAISRLSAGDVMDLGKRDYIHLIIRADKVLIP